MYCLRSASLRLPSDKILHLVYDCFRPFCATSAAKRRGTLHEAENPTASGVSAFADIDVASFRGTLLPIGTLADLATPVDSCRSIFPVTSKATLHSRVSRRQPGVGG